jgi:anaerobic magnesium-protoporphyrin IX monomethyl ester cyclase
MVQSAPMKILFANPPTFENAGSFFRPVRFPTYNYATPVMHPPLYLAYAASYIRSFGHDILFIDAPVHAISVESFIAQTIEFCPDFLVFETSTPSFSNDCRVVELIKKSLNHIKIVFLGTHVTARTEECLARDCIDAVVMGEYEISLAAYITHGPVNTAGIAYRSEDGSIVVNEKRPFCVEIDALPYPARDLLPNYKYFDPILKNPFTFVISGRGCPYPCTFCNWPQHLTGRIVRKRDPKEIVDEIEHIQNEYHFKSILFNDDTFTADKAHARAIADEIIRRDMRIKWGCYARADFDDRTVLMALRKAGCFLLKIGVETADEAIQKNVKKNYDLERVRRAVKTMLSLGFHVHATFAFGLPGETLATINKTIHYAKTLNATTVQFSIAVPYPGTEFYNYLKRHGYLVSENWDDYMPLKPIYEYPHLSYETMQRMLKKAYQRHYLRPKYFFVGLGQLLTQPNVFFGNLKKLLTLIFTHAKN